MLKKFLFSFFLITTSLILINCTNQNYLDDSIAVVHDLNNQPYLINAKGDTYSLSKYHYIVPHFDQYLIVANHKYLYGYIERNGREVIKPQYDSAYPFSEGKAVVTKNQKTYIIDSNNKILYTFDDQYRSTSTYQSGWLLIENINGQFAYLSSDFKISKSFEYATRFENGYAITGYTLNSQFYFNYLTPDLELLFDQTRLANYTNIDYFYNGYAKIGQSVEFNGWQNLLDYAETTESPISNHQFSLSTWGENIRLVYNGTTYTIASRTILKRLAWESGLFGDLAFDEIDLQVSSYDTNNYLEWINLNNGQRTLFLPKSFFGKLLALDVDKITYNRFGYLELTHNINISTPTVLKASQQFVYSYIDTTGNILLDGTENAYFSIANNFGDGIGTVFLQMPEEYNNYYYYTISQSGLKRIEAEGNLKSKGGFAYLITTSSNGVFAIKPITSGAGAWKIGIIDQDNYLVTKEFVVDERFNENVTSFYYSPFEMTNFRISAFYHDQSVSLARVLVYRNEQNSLYGLVDSNGNYIIDAIYTQLFY